MLGEGVPVFVVDTSVALKWFVAEDELDTAKAWALQDAFVRRRCILVAPELLLYELANALHAGRKFATDEIMRALDHVLAMDMQMHAFRRTTLGKAIDIATAFKVPVYDSYFLATAIEFGATFLTADEAYLRKVGRHANILPLRQLQIET